MNEPIATPADDLAVETPAEPEAPQELSLEEHEAQFNSGKKPDLPPLESAGETPEQTEARAQQARDRETGQFKQGKKKNPVKRINELTGRAKTAEERLAAAEAELKQLREQRVVPTNGNGNGQAQTTQTQQPVAAKQPERFVLPAPPFDPEPQEADPRFNGDYTSYLKESSRWAARQESRQMEFDRYVAAQQQQQRQAEQQIVTEFATRIDAAKSKYDDFEDVAFGPTPIQKDSLADIFITRDDNGAEMLYYLHRPEHRQELDALLKMPELQQVKQLTLLSQRLASTGNGTGPTTSAPSPRTIVLPPKPPNVVRTEAQRASGGIPTDRELSLSEHETYFAPKNQRR